MKNNGLFTSIRQDWKTPKAIYEGLDQEFNFDFDPCPSDPSYDGLEVEWGKSNFINPPYITKLQDAFVKKAYEESKKGKVCVLLIPARPSSKRWQNYILPYANEIRFLSKRLKFDDSKGTAPFCSAVIVFRGTVN